MDLFTLLKVATMDKSSFSSFHHCLSLKGCQGPNSDSKNFAMAGAAVVSSHTLRSLCHAHSCTSSWYISAGERPSHYGIPFASTEKRAEELDTALSQSLTEYSRKPPLLWLCSWAYTVSRTFLWHTANSPSVQLARCASLSGFFPTPLLFSPPYFFLSIEHFLVHLHLGAYF